MSSFSITRKKTPFQKHREEEEAKKKRAEDETARLYAEFLESFQGDDSGLKAFVRGGTVNPNDKVKSDTGQFLLTDPCMHFPVMFFSLELLSVILFCTHVWINE
ncbi:hypothetical protein Hanom_Chr03g00256771 [Helianthus anomalus]